MDPLLQDVKFALRMPRKARGVSAVAILSLALGIAVNTTVFSYPLHPAQSGPRRGA